MAKEEKEKITLECDDEIKDILNKMENRRKFIDKALAPCDKAKKDLENQTATEKVRLQGTKEPKVPNLNPFTAKVVSEGLEEGVSGPLQKSYRGMLVFVVNLNDGLVSCTAQWIKGGGKFGKAEPQEKIYKTSNLTAALNHYIKTYLDDFITKAKPDFEVNKDAYLRDDISSDEVEELPDAIPEEPIVIDSNVQTKVELQDSGVSTMINDLIKDELEAIDGYTSAIATLTEYGDEKYLKAVEIFKDIQEEENVHIGQLQEALKLFSHSAERIEDGKEEAKEVIGTEGELDNPDEVDEDGRFAFTDEGCCDNDFKRDDEEDDEKEILNEKANITLDDLRNFNPIAGAKDTWELILKNNKLEEFDKILEDMFPDGIKSSDLNDLCWFEKDWVLEQLGIDPFGNQDNDETIDV